MSLPDLFILKVSMDVYCLSPKQTKAISRIISVINYNELYQWICIGNDTMRIYY